ncbi:hypothetical protein B0T20DRAFT_477611 [Sordaria brevicollis]|uniref:Uncharacterized protein n=1 Tax=Sordaria brevicollis TaxID=83679 RepID=A0AAE0UD68_SORBR|nr:hypothetical protein B0T20DRAFT_477611 [Sordaria brevicollis]
MSSSQDPTSPEAKAASPKPNPAPPAAVSPSAEESAEDDILPGAHWTQQPLEPVYDDGASSIGSVTSTTASLSSSIFEYRTHHGRTYHSDIGHAES